VQLRWATFEGGANKPSLVQAQMTYDAIGASELRFKSNVRAPGEQDTRDPEWRRFDPARDYVPPPGAPWPDSGISYYWMPGPNQRR